jgi:1-acyl-sn-glycerol-3-phosphate acyltransferase
VRVVDHEDARSAPHFHEAGIAHEAGVPIVMAYMDYPRKLSGLGPVFQPTGKFDADMAAIKAWYAPFKGKNWQQFDNG